MTGRSASHALASGIVRVILTERVCASVFLVRVAERRIAQQGGTPMISAPDDAAACYRHHVIMADCDDCQLVLTLRLARDDAHRQDARRMTRARSLVARLAES